MPSIQKNIVIRIVSVAIRVDSVELPEQLNPKPSGCLHLAFEANEKRYEAYYTEQKAIRITNDEVIHVWAI
ncbi:MAG: hypothetical protein DRP87_19825 [Spirochaetes bacterium]|nr:MAG: hypothetical protein DRP87_19825 [Spirochaetota bacterium]